MHVLCYFEIQPITEQRFQPIPSIPEHERRMLLTTALVAACVATSSAFLIPPHISEDFKDATYRGGPPEHVKEFIHHLLEERTTTIDLKCHDCHFAIPASNEQGDYFDWSEQPVASNIVSNVGPN